MIGVRNWLQLGLVAAALVIFGPRSLAQSISCSSDDGHRRYCPADTRGGVRLLKQRSGSACNQGKSWGFDRGGVWVDHGCRADFAIDSYQYRGPAPDSVGTVSCSSDDGKRHYCTVDSGGRVRLQQLRRRVADPSGCEFSPGVAGWPGRCVAPPAPRTLPGPGD